MKFLQISYYNAFVDRHFTTIALSYETPQFVDSVALSSPQYFSIHDLASPFAPLLASSKLVFPAMVAYWWVVLELLVL